MFVCPGLTRLNSQELQIENAELRKQVRQSTSSAVTSASSSAAASATPDPLGQHSEDFDKLGRHFCAFNEIWVRPHHLRQPYPESLRELGPRHPAHYTNDQTKQCQELIFKTFSFGYFPNLSHSFPLFSFASNTVTTFTTPRRGQDIVFYTPKRSADNKWT